MFSSPEPLLDDILLLEAKCIPCDCSIATDFSLCCCVGPIFPSVYHSQLPSLHTMPCINQGPQMATTEATLGDFGLEN